MQIHTGRTCLIFRYCAFLDIFSNCLPLRMQNHIGRIFNSPPCLKVKLVALFSLVSTVRFQMFPQIACPMGSAHENAVTFSHQIFPIFENVLTWWFREIFLSLQSNLKIHMVT